MARPGLKLKRLIDRRGVSTRRWVRVEAPPSAVTAEDLFWEQGAALSGVSKRRTARQEQRDHRRAERAERALARRVGRAEVREQRAFEARARKAQQAHGQLAKPVVARRTRDGDVAVEASTFHTHSYVTKLKGIPAVSPVDRFQIGLPFVADTGYVSAGAGEWDVEAFYAASQEHGLPVAPQSLRALLARFEEQGQAVHAADAEVSAARARFDAAEARIRAQYGSVLAAGIPQALLREWNGAEGAHAVALRRREAVVAAWGYPSVAVWEKTQMSVLATVRGNGLTNTRI